MSQRPLPVEGLQGEYRLTLALDSWRQWQAPLVERPCVLGPAGVGLTNTSWLVASGSQRAVVRLNSPIGGRLGVDRHREACILTLLADTGITPPVWYNDPDQGFLVTAFLPGRLWTVDDLANARQRQRLRAVVERYQRIATDLPARNYEHYLDEYWRRLQSSGVCIPRSLAQRYHDCREGLSRWLPSTPAVLTHHDLTPANIIDFEGQLFLLDWEYAAPGCGDIDRLVVAAEDCSPNVQELVKLIDELWFLVRAAAGH